MKYFIIDPFKLIQVLTVCVMSLLVVSCTSEEEVPVGVDPAIELGCDFFLLDQTLKDNPNTLVDYVVACNASVEGKLTINPRVVIEFIKDGGLHFQTAVHSSNAKVSLENNTFTQNVLPLEIAYQIAHKASATTNFLAMT
jgi:hypothetical protein